LNRRQFLTSAAIAGLRGSATAFAGAASPSLDPWQPGFLDIHHLAYGRGNSTFALCPDGTTILIDAGVTEDSLDVSCSQKPDSDLRPGEWIASYILRQMKPAGRFLPAGEEFVVVVADNPDHLDRVKLLSGPYACA
jgi:hypothetical protein